MFGGAREKAEVMMIHPPKQGSEGWLSLRLGHPTASEFDKLVTPLWKIKTGDGPHSYLCEKLAEHITGKPLERGGTFAMEQGSILETEAVPYFELIHDVEVQRVGYCSTDDMRIGCSPDGLIGEDGGLECKCPFAQTHVRYLLDGVVPTDYLAQVHGSMFVTGRKWWKFMSYARGFPPLIVHVDRDEKIQAAIREALDGLLKRFDESLAKIQAMKDAK